MARVPSILKAVQVFEGTGDNVAAWVPWGQRYSVTWHCRELRDCPNEEGTGNLFLVDPDEETLKHLLELDTIFHETGLVGFNRICVYENKPEYTALPNGWWLRLTGITVMEYPRSQLLPGDDEHPNDCTCEDCETSIIEASLYLERA